MDKFKKPFCLLAAVFLCIMTVASIADTEEKRYETNFDQDAMYGYVENLTANGPRSILTVV